MTTPNQYPDAQLFPEYRMAAIEIAPGDSHESEELAPGIYGEFDRSGTLVGIEIDVRELVAAMEAKP